MNRLTKIIIPGVFYSLLLIFLFAYLSNTDFSELKNLELSIGYLVIASIVAILFRFLGSFIWFVILRGLGAKNLGKQKFKLIGVYAKAWLGRYIPGTAPWILGKIYFASKHGVSKNKLAVSSLLEGGLQITVVMAIAFGLLLFDPRTDVLDPRIKMFMAITISICSFLLVPVVFNKVVSLAYSVIRKKRLEKSHYVDTKTILIGVLLYGLGALISGLSLFFIAKSAYPALGYGEILFIMGVGNLSGAISMLAFFAPGGIGVREGVQLLLLGLIMPVEIALAITVVTRIWVVAMDLLFYGIAYSTRNLDTTSAGGDHEKY